ncbi:putative membrane protein [Lyngbya aestuarii BL J]|uniref:Putative membrane protein n=1 Tax=Lyngbya aestuarii BL J TaxID=1348334 RepID=U7Q9Z7_9CYAN|nr:putative membrane protein [Lyngbya aestuarii BL J]
MGIYTISIENPTLESQFFISYFVGFYLGIYGFIALRI